MGQTDPQRTIGVADAPPVRARRSIATAILVLLSVVPACGDDSAKPAASWAWQAEEVVGLLAAAYDNSDPYQTARFYSAGGTLDLTLWDLGVATTPDEVVKAVQRLWFQEPGKATVEPEHLFVSPDSAVVWWWAYDPDGGQDWVQTYAFGAGGRTASRAFRALEVGFEDISETETAILDLVDRYVRAWAARDEEVLSALYAPGVAVLDETRGHEWRGASDLLAGLDTAPPIDHGPWPRVFVYESGNHVEAIVLVQAAGDCPMLEARRVVLDGDQIVREVRFTHVPSARRCLETLPDGWWSTFELPPDLQNNVTEVLDTGGSLVDLVNAEPSHEMFARWAFGRYLESGIGVPEVEAVWFPPAPECTELAGLAIESDERYQGRHTVAVCFSEDRLGYPGSESGWSPPAVAYGLHELAHVWMVDRLTDETRAAFNDLTGLTVWRSAEAQWRERGVEHAAFTIAWGLAGAIDARYPILPPPECAELAARYRLLTGHDPITRCGEGGWSP